MQGNCSAECMSQCPGRGLLGESEPLASAPDGLFPTLGGCLWPQWPQHLASPCREANVQRMQLQEGPTQPAWIGFQVKAHEGNGPDKPPSAEGQKCPGTPQPPESLVCFPTLGEEGSLVSGESLGLPLDAEL